MSIPQNTIAVIFDFDDTLTDDSTTALLQKHGIDTKKFWNELVSERVKDEWDPTLAYLDLILDHVGEGKPFGMLKNQDLVDFGSTLIFYEGIPQLFDSLRDDVSKHKLSHPSIEFFIISGGLESIITGTGIAQYFSGIWGCCFEEQDSHIQKIKNVISFTEKTKYVFYINKGMHTKARSDQYLVNEEVKKEQRRIPFENMIYIGDGFTDVPCFSLIQQYGGQAFGVFDPKRKKDSPKKAWEKLVVPKRVSSMNSPQYGPDQDLGSLIRAAVKQICIRLDLNSQSAVPFR